MAGKNEQKQKQQRPDHRELSSEDPAEGSRSIVESHPQVESKHKTPYKPDVPRVSNEDPAEGKR